MSQIAKKKFPHAMLLGGLSVNLNLHLNHLKRTGPMLRSSKNKQTVNEVKEQVEAVTNKGKEEICADFLSVAGTVIAAGVYTVASQFINMHLF